MNKQLRDEWVKALRSNKYNQTTGLLQDQDGHCCLGVLCEVASKRGYRVRRDDAGYLEGQLLDDQSKRLNSLVSDGDSDALTRMNDAGESFTKIAKYIETNIPVTP